MLARDSHRHTEEAKPMKHRNYCHMPSCTDANRGESVRRTSVQRAIQNGAVSEVKRLLVLNNVTFPNVATSV